MLIAISDGEGVQSNTLKAMVAFGDLPSVDVAIHSDTTHEQSATYAHRAKWLPFWEDRDIRCVTVKPARTLDFERAGSRCASIQIPAFTQRPGYWGTKTFKDGTKKRIWKNGSGQLRRQCTQRWKIAPMRKWLQANRGKEPVELWIGFSLDEIQRIKPSNVKYITNRYPLIEKRMTRAKCIKYLEAHQIEVPAKSSCVFCPYHNKAAWRKLYQTGSGDWHKAVEIDNAARKVRPPYNLFVHSSRKPLEQIANEIDAQPDFDYESEECDGVCFL